MAASARPAHGTGTRPGNGDGTGTRLGTRHRDTPRDTGLGDGTRERDRDTPREGGQDTGHGTGTRPGTRDSGTGRGNGIGTRPGNGTVPGTRYRDTAPSTGTWTRPQTPGHAHRHRDTPTLPDMPTVPGHAPPRPVPARPLAGGRTEEGARRDADTAWGDTGGTRGRGDTAIPRDAAGGHGRHRQDSQLPPRRGILSVKTSRAAKQKFHFLLRLQECGSGTSGVSSASPSALPTSGSSSR
ncbi:uncharacterized protein [Agelaius tricolor]|uniref:uncharacterized protein n=1 Tax=Agelaius tricolor TaxID=9191 RepID=UPI0039F17F37